MNDKYYTFVNDLGSTKIFNTGNKIAEFQVSVMVYNGTFIIDHTSEELWGECSSGHEFIIPSAPKLHQLLKNINQKIPFRLNVLSRGNHERPKIGKALPNFI